MSVNINIIQPLPFAPPLELPLKLQLPQGRFGAKRSNPQPGRFHTGVDLHAPVGTPVFPVYGGIVIDARGDAEGQTPGDGIVTILHQPAGNDGYITRYIHLKTVSVSVNDFIEVGTQLGTVGVPDGETWEPHLHFELRHTVLTDLSSLSANDRNNELKRSSRSIAVDPTRQLYHWELEHYKNNNTTDRNSTGLHSISEIGDLISQHIRYYRIRLDGVRGSFYIPLYEPTNEELSLVETLRLAYSTGKKVDLAWRKSHFFEDKQVIAEVRISC
jgi:murein DD-endopeptidase MepM/ murein hydrolase activator NlpD